jgi:hypothetical protein
MGFRRSGSLPAWVVADGTQPIIDTRLPGDSGPQWRLLADGRIRIGGGDGNLYGELTWSNGSGLTIVPIVGGAPDWSSTVGLGVDPNGPTATMGLTSQGVAVGMGVHGDTGKSSLAMGKGFIGGLNDAQVIALRLATSAPPADALTPPPTMGLPGVYAGLWWDESTTAIRARVRRADGTLVDLTLG